MGEVPGELTLGELREAIRENAQMPADLNGWVAQAVLRPGVCEAIEALVGSSDDKDKPLVAILRSTLLKCLCPSESEDRTWSSHGRRQALVLAVGEAFCGRAYTPFIAKIEQLWGWECSWVDPPLSAPVAFARGPAEDHRTKKLLVVENG